jgi:hypothetical protein
MKETSTLLIRTIIASAWFVASLATVACDKGPEPIFPADFQSTYQEVRDCRRSGDHDLNHVRVLTAPDAKQAYQSREVPFPAGAIVLKVEYADPECTDVAGFTAMLKEPAGSAPTAGDWFWQRVDARREVLEEGQPARCVGCHRPCQAPAGGYDWTCTEP